MTNLPVPSGEEARDGPQRRRASEIERVRHVFWQNVVQQTLASLPAAASKQPELFDGRVAVLTKGGERIPIRAVHPVFACSVRQGTAQQRTLALAVQCTIFRIETPSGEAFTLPLEEIRAIHTISDELMEHVQQQAEQAAGALAQQKSGEDKPFGFAAFTSMARQDEDDDQSAAE